MRAVNAGSIHAAFHSPAGDTTRTHFVIDPFDRTIVTGLTREEALALTNQMHSIEGGNFDEAGNRLRPALGDLVEASRLRTIR